jgi:hypothetical protein
MTEHGITNSNGRPWSAQERNPTGYVRAMADAELEAIRRDLVTNLGFTEPGNGMYAPSQTLLSVVKSEITRRKRLLAIGLLLEEPEEISDGLEGELYALRDRLHLLVLDS